MLKFDNTITLSNKLAVIVPKEHKLSEFYVAKLQSVLSDFFGGATATDCSGAYVMEDGSLCLEQNVIVYAYYDTMSTEQEERLVQLVLNMKHDMKQECIGIEQNGVFQMVF